MIAIERHKEPRGKQAQMAQALESVGAASGEVCLGQRTKRGVLTNPPHVGLSTDPEAAHTGVSHHRFLSNGAALSVNVW